MRARLALFLLPLLLLVAPAGAVAQTSSQTEIDGSPLNVFTDQSGRIGAALDGAPGEFFPSSSNVEHAGFDIQIDPQGSSISRYGAYEGFLPTPDSGPTLTPGNPATITTVWTLTDFSSTPVARLTQKLVYTNGSRQFDAQYTVQNLSSSPISFRAWELADLSIRGSDAGIGFLNGTAPSRFVGGVNQDVGAVGGLVEETPWSAFESNVLSHLNNDAADATGPGLDNSIAPTVPPPIDNAAGVQWDNFYPPNTLAAGASTQFNVAWRFIDTLGLSPLAANELTGNEHVITAHVGDINGKPQAGQRIIWTVIGANPATGTAITDSTGTAQFSWVGGNAGHDDVTAFVDQNNNGNRDENEPQAAATVDWSGPPPPVPGTSVDARVESGRVRVKFPKKLPPGFVAKTDFAHAAATGKFVPLTTAQRIPVGSTVDTSFGTVRLTTAANTTGQAFNGGSFSGGQFLIGQGRRGGTAQMTLMGGALNGCGAPLPKGGAARVRHRRRLFSSVRGSFRTRGRNASATVRGTQWLMQDTCKGTLTVVKQGAVTVRDFTLRKTKVVRAGHKYLAKPPRGRRH